MIKIQCQGCGELANIGKICRECGATIPTPVYEGAKTARDAYGGISAVLGRLDNIGPINISNIGVAVQLYQECVELMQKLDAYQSFFQEEFNSLKNKTTALDANIQPILRQYNADIDDLMDKMETLIGSVNSSNFQKAKNLCHVVQSFEKSKYDTGQYTRLQNKRVELEQRFVRVGDQIAARKQLNSKSVKRWVSFFLYWGVIVTGAFILFSKIYPYLAVDNAPGWVMKVVWGFLIFDVVLFLIAGGIVGGGIGAIISAIGNAVIQIIVVFRLSRMEGNTREIIFCKIQAVLLFIPLAIICGRILRAQAFTTSKELKDRAGRHGPTPVTIFVLIALAVAGGLVRHFYSGMGFIPSFRALVETPATVTATVTSNAANIRSAPDSSKNNIITQVKNGSTLIVTGPVENGWLPVEVDGKPGYVSADLVTVNDR